MWNSQSNARNILPREKTCGILSQLRAKSITHPLIIGGGNRLRAVKDARLHVIGRCDAGTRVLLLLVRVSG